MQRGRVKGLLKLHSDDVCRSFKEDPKHAKEITGAPFSVTPSLPLLISLSCLPPLPHPARKLAEGKGHETASKSALLLPPASWHLTDKDKLVSLFSVLLYVAWKRGLPKKIARFVLFRLIKKHSFNLLCVLDLFSERWQSTLFQILL